MFEFLLCGDLLQLRRFMIATTSRLSLSFRNNFCKIDYKAFHYYTQLKIKLFSFSNHNSKFSEVDLKFPTISSPVATNSFPLYNFSSNLISAILFSIFTQIKAEFFSRRKLKDMPTYIQTTSTLTSVYLLVFL